MVHYFQNYICVLLIHSHNSLRDKYIKITIKRDTADKLLNISLNDNTSVLLEIPFTTDMNDGTLIDFLVSNKAEMFECMLLDNEIISDNKIINLRIKNISKTEKLNASLIS